MNNIPKLMKFFRSNFFIGSCFAITISLSSLMYLFDNLKTDFIHESNTLKYQIEEKLNYERISLEASFRLLDRLDISNIFHILDGPFFDLYYIDNSGKIIATTNDDSSFNSMMEFTFQNMIETGMKNDEFFMLSIERHKRDILMSRKSPKSEGYLVGKMNTEDLLKKINIDSKFIIYDSGGYILKTNAKDVKVSENINAEFIHQINFLDFYIAYHNGYNLGVKVRYNKDLNFFIYINMYDILHNIHLYLFLGFLFLFFFQFFYFMRGKKFIQKYYDEVIDNITKILKDNTNNSFEPMSKIGDDLFLLENSICERLNKSNDFLEYINELENRLRSFFSENQVPMLTINSYTGQIINANDAAVEFYGYDKTILMQKTLYTLNVKSAESIAYSVYESIKNKQNYIQAQHVVKRGQNEEIIKNVRIYPFSINSRVRYDYLMIIDFTEIDNKLMWIDSEKFYFEQGPVSALYIEVENEELIVSDIYQKSGSVFGRNNKKDIVNKKYFDLFVGGHRIGNNENNLAENDKKTEVAIVKHNTIKQKELISAINKIDNGGTNKLLEQGVYLKDRKNNNTLYRVYYRFIADRDLRINKIIAFVLDFDTSMYEDKKTSLLLENFEKSSNATMILNNEYKALAINDYMCELFDLNKNTILENKTNMILNSKLDMNIKNLIQICVDNTQNINSHNTAISDVFMIATTMGAKQALVVVTPSVNEDESDEKKYHYIVSIALIDK